MSAVEIPKVGCDDRQVTRQQKPEHLGVEMQGVLQSYWQKIQQERGDEAFGALVGLKKGAVYQKRTGRMRITVDDLARLAAVQDKSELAVLIEVGGLAYDAAKAIATGKSAPRQSST